MSYLRLGQYCGQQRLGNTKDTGCNLQRAVTVRIKELHVRHGTGKLHVSNIGLDRMNVKIPVEGFKTYERLTVGSQKQTSPHTQKTVDDNVNLTIPDDFRVKWIP